MRVHVQCVCVRGWARAPEAVSIPSTQFSWWRLFAAACGSHLSPGAACRRPGVPLLLSNAADALPTPRCCCCCCCRMYRSYCHAMRSCCTPSPSSPQPPPPLPAALLPTPAPATPPRLVLMESAVTCRGSAAPGEPSGRRAAAHSSDCEQVHVCGKQWRGVCIVKPGGGRQAGECTGRQGC